ncbi:MAG: aminopeptidase [Bacteroidales bacterium]|nr:aminopeptidase [Bacteroidales bacterium]
MKKTLIICLPLFSCVFAATAQPKRAIDFPEYVFTTEIANPITSVKNQASSGTCWAYSTIGFVESEIIRINGIKDEKNYPDLSEFFVVSHSYSDRASKYVRLDGHLTFAAGSEADDVLDVIRDYGIVPQNEMTGMNYGSELPRQAEMDAVLKAYVGAVVSAKKPLTTAWKRGFDAVLAEYLGAYPEKFVVDGVEYTPETYRDALKFNANEYVGLTSFTHVPFYTWNELDVCDNWRADKVFNVPVDEMIDVLDAALKAGYTAAWGADVSEDGFTRNGLAILVDVKATDEAGSDQAHWVGTGDAKKDSKAAPKKNSKVNNIVEKETSQEIRQTLYDNKTTTDDHGMQIFGIAHDQWGNKYYMVKNSWGEAGKYKGIWYASEAFVRNQTMDILLHVSALPEELRAKTGK